MCCKFMTEKIPLSSSSDLFVSDLCVVCVVIVRITDGHFTVIISTFNGLNKFIIFLHYKHNHSKKRRRVQGTETEATKSLQFCNVRKKSCQDAREGVRQKFFLRANTYARGAKVPKLMTFKLRHAENASRDAEQGRKRTQILTYKHVV